MVLGRHLGSHSEREKYWPDGIIYLSNDGRLLIGVDVMRNREK